MGSKDYIAAKEWVANWLETGPLLERMRIEAFRKLNLSDMLLSLNDAARASLLAHPPKPTSGIIEMQKLFAKLRK